MSSSRLTKLPDGSLPKHLVLFFIELKHLSLALKYYSNTITGLIHAYLTWRSKHKIENSNPWLFHFIYLVEKIDRHEPPTLRDKLLPFLYYRYYMWLAHVSQKGESSQWVHI